MGKRAPTNATSLVLGAAVVLAFVAWIGLGPVPPVRGDGAAEDERVADGVVGAEACAQCHLAQYERWAGASHATTLEEAGPWNMPASVKDGTTVEHAPGRTTFRIEGEGEDTRYVAETLGPDGDVVGYPLTHVVGKRRIRMYVTALPDGRQQVLPGMFEEPTGTWFDYTQLIFGGPDADPALAPVVRPGEPSFWTGPVRAFQVRCAGCHVSGRHVEPPKASGELGRTSWRRMGIDCEMCHGPGAAHATAQGGGGGEDTMPSFGAMDRETSVSVCMRCHMEGEPVDLAMRPGEDILEHIDPTLLDDAERVDAFGRPLELIYDGLPFLAGECARRGELTCFTCHDPHGSAHPAQLRTPRDDPALCQACHAEIAEDVASHAHHPVGSTGAVCTSCHMPYLTIERGHGIVTDHTISIPRPEAVSDRLATDACTWCHQGGRGAPTGAPALARDALVAGYRRWWPDPTPPPVWQRVVAAARMDEEGRPETLVDLMTLLADDEVPRLYRATALRILARFPEAARSALLHYAGHADSLLRREAVRGLAFLRGTDVDAILARAAGSDPSPAVRRNAARAALRGWSRVKENAALLRTVLTALEADAHAVPDDDARWFRLGAARELAGDLEGAIEAYARQVVLDRLNPNVPRHLETLRARLSAAEDR